MTPLDSTVSAAGADRTPPSRGGRRVIWHAVAWLLAAAVTALIFASYRQPDLILDLAGMRLCEAPPLRAPVG